MTHHNMELLTNEIMLEFSKTVEMFGLTTLEARLFAYLYLSEGPLTLDEMSEALGKSKTSMSTSVRSLSELNLATRVWKKGTRKDLYQANTQLFKTFMKAYFNKWIDASQRQKNALAEIYETIGVNHDQQGSTAEIKYIDNQLNEIIEFHKEMESLFRNIKLH